MKIMLAAINSKFVHTNLALRYIKAYCRGDDIKLKEYSINDSLYSVVNDIYMEKSDIIGFSCYIWNIDMVLKVSGSLKKLNPDAVIVLGGPEVSYDCTGILRDNGHIDFIVKGEGEVSSKQLFSYIEKGAPGLAEIGGLVYKKDGKIIENHPAPYIENLDSIPFPYTGEEKCFENKIIYYESSRGCPFNCSYCLSSTIKGVRFFSLERVKKDLLWFINNNISLVKFVDRTFNCGPNYLDILKFLAENMKNTRFHFEVSAGILDEKTIDFLSTVPPGLFQFEIGVQSTNQDTLNLIHRKDDFLKLSDNVRKLMSGGNIEIYLDLIAGLPGEDFESFSKSFNDVMELRPHVLQLGFLKLLKGSSLRDRAREFGILFNSYPPYEVLGTKNISFEDLFILKEIENIVDIYYNSRRFKCSVLYLLSMYKNPYDLFFRLKDFISLKIRKNRSIGNNERYKLLYDFCIYSGIGDTGILRECLAFDYLCQGRNRAVPEFLQPDKKVEKQYLYDFLSDEDNVKVFLPHYTGYGLKEIIKRVYFRTFAFDICYFVKSGIIKDGNRTVIFDYGTKREDGSVALYAFR